MEPTDLQILEHLEEWDDIESILLERRKSLHKNSSPERTEEWIEANFIMADSKEKDEGPLTPGKGSLRNPQIYRALPITNTKSHESIEIPQRPSTKTHSDKQLSLSHSNPPPPRRPSGFPSIGDEGEEEEEPLQEAGMAFLLSLFGPLWSLGMAYWLYEDGKLSEGILTAVITTAWLGTLHIAYLLPKSSPIRLIWKKSKLVFLLCLLPGMPSVILSTFNFYFAVRESSSRTYERLWKGTRYLFLVDSLVLAFPQCLLHLVLLVENPLNVWTYQGYTQLAGIIIFSFSLTFSRFRYDCQYKSDRMGSGLEKWVRFCCLWANKALWIVTYTLSVLCFRLAFPSHLTLPTFGSLLLMLLVHEVPILFLLIPCVEKRAPSFVQALMLIPQCTSLVLLLAWVNLDPDLYSSDTGSFLLGIFFWSELIILSGWLYDRCTGREVDLLPFYPHFFGDICTNLRK